VRRYAIQTFGCRVNQSDSTRLARDLEAAQWSRDDDAPDLVVLNTCTVTHRSDADVRKAVHRIQRQLPDAKVVVTGCMAQRAPEPLVQLGVHGILGNTHKRDIAAVGEAVLTAASPVVRRSDWQRGPPPVDPVGGVLDRSRPFVKIQDGCDAHCTYCIIPSVRGAARSADPQRVVDTVRDLVREGHHEVVVTGVHLGTYGAHLDPPTSFSELTFRLLELPGLGRLRLSCIEPMAFPLDIVDRAATDDRLAPHFHLPLQSGSDAVLKRMVRPYRAADFVDVARTIRQRLPHACLGTDVIVGFPGETDTDFDHTIDTVSRAELDYVHVFSYSDRDGTPSTRLGPKLDSGTIKHRSSVLNQWSRRAWQRFLHRRVGTTVDAVSLDVKQGSLQTLAADYTPVDVAPPIPAIPPNRPVRVRVESVVGHRTRGRVILAHDTDTPA
jgi:threonylcarbamoyladenosine tRNA methylthiotransferase MtaB